MKFTKAIVRKPCRNIINGITTANLGLPDYEKSLVQHKEYISILESCGLSVEVLNADENFPDSVFVEDTAILIPNLAVVTNPGANSRKGEINVIKEILSKYFSNIEEIKSPGTIEGGDVLRVENHFYIGLSERTNEEGAKQFLDILKKYNYSGQTIELKNVLHLKTGVSYLGDNTILASGEFILKKEFSNFNIIEVDDDEEYAANSLNINDKILIPKGFSKTKRKIEKKGFNIIEINVSEFRKVDGGLSCLSLRF